VPITIVTHQMKQIHFISTIAKRLAGKTRPRNDLICVKWHVKLYTLAQLFAQIFVTHCVVAYYCIVNCFLLHSCVLPVQMYVRTVAKTCTMAGNYRQDDHGFYYMESANYNPAGYEFSTPGNQFPVDP